MVKTRKIKVKSIENEEIIMTMTKTIITKIIITIMMRMRIKIGTCKSIQVKATHISLKGRNVQKAIFYWSAKITCCRWLSLSLKKKKKKWVI